MNPAATSVLAHQGGWDEVMLVALPLLVIASLLLLANKRVTAKLDESASPQEPEDGPDQS